MPVVGLERGSVIKIRLCALASGSRGNCTYIECGRTRLLLDAGLSMRDTVERLGRIGVMPDELTAIVLSHEHIDHVRGVGPLARRYRLPLYVTARTLAAAGGVLGNSFEVREFEPGTPVDIGGVRVEPFSIPHDAADPVGFAFHYGGLKVGIATDLGYASRLVLERLSGSDALIVESNHDARMLREGPYPWHLKQRISGKEGHLSNDDAALLVTRLLHPGLRHVALAHLSETNNMAELAYGSMRDTLDAGSFQHVGLSVAIQDDVGRVIAV